MENQNAIVNQVVKRLGIQKQVVVKEILIGGKSNIPVHIIYVDGQADKKLINKDILEPLMLRINEELQLEDELPEYLCKRYIPSSDTKVITDMQQFVESIRAGNTGIVVDYIDNYILVNSVSGEYRGISDPINEYSIKGSRESFVENIQTNISIMTRRIKEESLTIENFKVGKRSKSDLSILYIKSLVNEDALKTLKDRINNIDVDFVSSNGVVEQYLEESTYSIFPQIYSTERPDIVEANLMEGRIAVILSGNSQVITVPALFIEFFHGVEDYSQRFWVANFTRVLRFLTIIIIITLPSIYLSLVKYNVELIPVQFIIPINQSRVGIALSPFSEILSMEIIVELLREGGLRLPSKIAQTLSIVGGIIIGQTAVEAKIVSPPTALIVGITVVSTFLIPNYEMSLSIRLLRFVMLIMANYLGVFGIAIGWFLIITHVYRLKTFGVPYFSINKEDMKDTFIIKAMWKMDKRPEDLEKKNIKRQGNMGKMGKTTRGKKNE
ncbi:spore germination protein [Clostridium botulinum]|uniref:Spore germination protein n=1 Tax=Clostridium botulinum C/D str. DC5 TaxID=1443128 RepID=A0A0A0IF86_CLOBO|nr:spore germination protein [Clostridium botulinum]KGM95140.1 spore germination protein [Clostridium botulinum D str. CCUG 7971]KGN00130.1 spore germination protein [Clostridium botulinum C/D str. DC5]KOC50767.1 spore germination protein [Clostridium botulinum]KOC53370.1 spore germination protein [Clostridium botulinum]KOC57152.1 spore germination protein [Clostridium botulinum]